MVFKCPPRTASFWPKLSTSPEPTLTITPFVILFDGSSGSSWFAQSLDRHKEVLIAGYEPLEWTNHDNYNGPNATQWQALWLSHVWRNFPRANSNFSRWLEGYISNRKLDPMIHHSPLTVRIPSRAEVVSALAAGFKVRPATIESNQLSGTLREALLRMGGKTLIVNRRNRVKQALSLYRRRVQGKGQFMNAQGHQEATHIQPSELSVLLRRREEQARAIECTAHDLGAPVLRIFYEDLQRDFFKTMGYVLDHLGVDGSKKSLTEMVISEDGAAAGAAAGASAGFDRASPSISRLTNQSAVGSSSGSKFGSGSSFSKKTPESLCLALTNLPELCAYFRNSPYRGDFEPFLSQHDCKCPQKGVAQPDSDPARRGLDGAREGKASVGSLFDDSTIRADEALTARETPLCVETNSAEPPEGSNKLPTEPFQAAPLFTETFSRFMRGNTGIEPVGEAAGTQHMNEQEKLENFAAGDNRAPEPSNFFRAIVGTHHKTGTVLMGQVMRVASKGIERMIGEKGAGAAPQFLRHNWTACTAFHLHAAICLEEHVHLSQLASLFSYASSGKYHRGKSRGLPLLIASDRVSSGTPQLMSTRTIRFVHLLRDPIEICVSGYQYHKKATESWVKTPRVELGGKSWQSFFEQVSEADGIRTECVRGLTEIKEQAEIFLHFQTHPHALSVRLEDLDRNFSHQMRAIFNFFRPAIVTRGGMTDAFGKGQMLTPASVDRLVRSTSKFDLTANAPKFDKVDHVSSGHDKERLRLKLLSHPRLRRALDALRQILAYKPAGSAPPDAACVFNEVDDIVQSFWRAQNASLIGQSGWHFNL